MKAEVVRLIEDARSVAGVRAAFRSDRGGLAARTHLELWLCPSCGCKCLTARKRICLRCRDEEIVAGAVRSLKETRPTLSQVAQHLQCGETPRLARAFRTVLKSMAKPAVTISEERMPAPAALLQQNPDGRWIHSLR